MGKPYGAGFWDMSEFLLGDISIVVIFVESDGLNWLANQNPDANLSFTYHDYYGRTNPDAQTGYEPIEKPSGCGYP